MKITKTGVSAIRNAWRTGVTEAKFATFVLVLAAMSVLVAYIDTAEAKQVSLLNVSYDPTRELYKEFNDSFAKYWKEKTGDDVFVQQSHAGAGAQGLARPHRLRVVVERHHPLGAQHQCRQREQAAPAPDIQEPAPGEGIGPEHPLGVGDRMGDAPVVERGLDEVRPVGSELEACLGVHQPAGLIASSVALLVRRSWSV